MGPRHKRVRRRQLLATLGTAATVGIAGCASDTTADKGSPSPTPSVSASLTPTPSNPTSTPAPHEPFDNDTIERARAVGVSLRSSVAAIERGGERIAGSGWYFTAEDLIVTAAHVVEDTEHIRGWLPDGTESALSPIGADDDADVAAVWADVTAPTVSAGSAETLTPGQPLVQVGNPRDVGHWTIALGRFQEADPQADTFRTTLPAAGGFSGGPTATLEGDIVGLLAGSDPIHRRSLREVEPEPPTPYGPDDRLSFARHEPIGVIADLVRRWAG